MLTAVQNLVPELFPYVFSAYKDSSFLFFGEEIILSQEGVQQGDPLGPLLFCVTIHSLVQDLRSEFKVFYLDDGTLCGSLPDVLEDLKRVESLASDLGLMLNRCKSKVVCNDPPTLDAFLADAPGFSVVNASDTLLLGSAIGGPDACRPILEAKIGMLRTMGVRLSHLASHDALLLLSHSIAIPKMLYVLRTAPCFLHPDLLETYDSALRSALSSITNVHLVDDRAWLQATLPIRQGGLGIRRATQLAPSAFLACAAGCSTLIAMILPSTMAPSSDPATPLALAA